MESSDKYSTERSLLASELAQVLGMVRELEAHMGQSSTAARDLCRALASTMRSSIDKSIRISSSCCTESTQSVDGGDGSDAGKDAHCKRRKVMPKVKNQVRVSSAQDVGSLDDGLSWRKYGQKDILGAKYPRAYFRCTHRLTQRCFATKQVQRTDGDPLLFDVVYQGTHTCSQIVRCNKLRPSLISTEHLQLQPGQAQSLSPAVQTEGLQLEGIDTTMPFPCPSTPVNTDNNACCNMGCYASPFVSPANSGCQLSSDYATGSVKILKSVPDGELASAMSSPVAMDMELFLQFDDDFLNPSEFFLSDIRNP